MEHMGETAGLVSRRLLWLTFSHWFGGVFGSVGCWEIWWSCSSWASTWRRAPLLSTSWTWPSLTSLWSFFLFTIRVTWCRFFFCLNFPDVIFTAGYLLFLFYYLSSTYLLTAISEERCLPVLFPTWYRCHHHSHLSDIVCGVLWALPGLCICLTSICCNFYLPQGHRDIQGCECHVLVWLGRAQAGERGGVSRDRRCWAPQAARGERGPPCPVSNLRNSCSLSSVNESLRSFGGSKTAFLKVGLSQRKKGTCSDQNIQRNTRGS